jgi:hypothetical protein
MIFLARVIASVVVGLVLANGVVMLVSPVMWFRLPAFLAFRGTLRPDRLATAGGRLEVRVLGFVLVAVIVSAVGHIMLGPQQTHFHDPAPVRPSRGLMYVIFCLVPCLGAFGCGIVMLMRPRWWVENYFVRPGSEGRLKGPAFEWVMRALSLPLIVVAVYIAWRCLVAV